jgi:anti-sigma factor RsiW
MASVNAVSPHLSMLLSCYLDGELTKPELSEVVDALETDLDAIAEFRRIKDSRNAVRTMPTLNVPLHLMPGGHLSEQLSAYLDGELVTAEIPVVASHIDTCSDCRRELAELDRSRTAVRALPGVEPPVFLASRREEKKRNIGLRTAVAVAAGVAAVSFAFAAAPFDSGDSGQSVSIIDLESRHTARASFSASVTGVEAGSP